MTLSLGIAAPYFTLLLHKCLNLALNALSWLRKFKPLSATLQLTGSIYFMKEHYYEEYERIRVHFPVCP